MGFNTTVVVLNDALSYIAEDPEFGRRLYDAISNLSRDKRGYVSAHSVHGGVYCNAATVIETHHADHDVTVVVGGNRGYVADPKPYIAEAKRPYVPEPKTPEISQAALKSACSAFARMQGRQLAASIYGHSQTYKDFEAAMRAALEDFARNNNV